MYNNGGTCNWTGAYDNPTRGEEDGDKSGWYRLRMGYEGVLGGAKSSEGRWTLRFLCPQDVFVTACPHISGPVAKIGPGPVRIDRKIDRKIDTKF